MFSRAEKSWNSINTRQLAFKTSHMEKLLSLFSWLSLSECSQVSSKQLFSCLLLLPRFITEIKQRSRHQKSDFCSQINYSLSCDLGPLIYFNFKGNREDKINHCGALKCCNGRSFSATNCGFF